MYFYQVGKILDHPEILIIKGLFWSIFEIKNTMSCNLKLFRFFSDNFKLIHSEPNYYWREKKCYFASL